MSKSQIVNGETSPFAEFHGKYVTPVMVDGKPTGDFKVIEPRESLPLMVGAARMVVASVVASKGDKASQVKIHAAADKLLGDVELTEKYQEQLISAARKIVSTPASGRAGRTRGADVVL